MSSIAIMAGLAAIAYASPVAIPTPAITPGPRAPPKVLAARQDSITTIPVSSCINFADPDNGSDGCYCSGYDSLLSYTTVDGTAGCSYSQIVTIASAANGYPFTTTEGNDAIVAYAESTQYPGGTEWYGTGDATTLQGGSSVSLQMNPTGSVNVGYATESAQLSSLYTAVSNNLISACGSPTSGQTLSTCSPPAAITNIAYIDAYQDLKGDGKLEMAIPLVNIHDANVLQVLAVAVANGVVGNAADPGNTKAVEYFCDSCWQDYTDLPTVNLTNAPDLYLATFTEQTEATNGQIESQDLEVQFTLEAASGAFGCSDAGVVLSGLSALGSIIPGFGFLGLGAVGSVGRFGLSLGCDLTAHADGSSKRDLNMTVIDGVVGEISTH